MAGKTANTSDLNPHRVQHRKKNNNDSDDDYWNGDSRQRLKSAHETKNNGDESNGSEKPSKRGSNLRSRSNSKLKFSSNRKNMTRGRKSMDTHTQSSNICTHQVPRRKSIDDGRNQNRQSTNSSLTSSKSNGLKRKHENKKRRRQKRRPSLSSSSELELSIPMSISSTTTSQVEKSTNKKTNEDQSNMSNIQKQKLPILKWDIYHHPIPTESEEAILPLLMKYGKKEHGMFKNQKPFRIRKLKQACCENDIRLDQALSLRRHHIVNLNPKSSMTQLGLGLYRDIKQSSVLFEEAVAAYLKQQRHPNTIHFFDEEQQREQFHKSCEENASSSCTERNMPPTPDFLFQNTVQIVKRDKRRYHHHRCPSNSKSNPKYCQAAFDANWIDAKMFYGASTIQSGTKNAVGSLLATARKYVALYGQGAFVFYNGYGKELETQLLEEGVLILDASPLDLRNVYEHQRTWCSDNNGEILP